MLSPFDFRRIFEHEFPGLHWTGGDQGRAPCAFHGGDNPDAVLLNASTGHIECFTGCGRGWFIVDWIAEHYDIPKNEAWSHINHILGRPDSKDNLTPWGYPFPPPTSITNDPFSLSNLASGIEFQRQLLIKDCLTADEHRQKAGKPPLSEKPPNPQPYALYEYEDDQGGKDVKVRYQDPARKGKKTMRWFAYQAHNKGWAHSLRKLERKARLYRASTLGRAAATGEPVLLLNGEKACQRALQDDPQLLVTCCPNGERWDDVFLKDLDGVKEIYLVADNDEKGREFAAVATAAQLRAGISARIVTLPNQNPKDDLYDYLERGGTLAEFLEIAKNSPPGDPAYYGAVNGNRADGPPPPPPAGEPPSINGPDLTIYGRTDTGNSLRLVALSREGVNDETARGCCICVVGTWHFWNGTHWAPDPQRNAIMALAQRTMTLAMQQAKARGDDPGRIWAEKSLNLRGLDNMIRIASHHPLLSVTREVMDAQPLLIPCLNGTYDLAAGTWRENRKEDLLTKVFPRHYDPKQPLPNLFLRTVEELMGGGPEVTDETALEEAWRWIDYLQTVFGYCLTGDTSEKAVFVFLGQAGDDGKTLLLTTVADVMGQDYATGLDSKILINDAFRGASDTNRKSEMARSKGVRLLLASEPDRSHFNQQFVKDISQGAGTLTGAFKGHDTFRFTPTAKLAIETNHMLQFSDDDPAFLKRLHIIRFNLELAKERIDRALPQKLVPEHDAIFTWLMKGAIRWREEGLQRPIAMAATITAVTQENIEADDLNEFLEECFDFGPFATHGCRVTEAHELYRAWHAEHRKKEIVMGRNKFSARLALRTWAIQRIQPPPGNHKAYSYLRGLTPKERYVRRDAWRSNQYKDDPDDD